MKAAVAPFSRVVARPLGFVSGGMALFMALCAFTMPLTIALGGQARPVDENATLPMAISASICGLFGLGLWWHGRATAGTKFGRREGTFVVAAIWLGTGVFGGLPYLLGASMTPADAFFESVSGFTTTGATVVAEIEDARTGLSRPILLWRAVTQWLGGMGIVVLFVAVFPNIGVGGKHLFRSEAPGPSGSSLRPRIAETSLFLWKLYALMTALLVVLLWLQGMHPFESVCHAMTTLSTGGFSTRNGSIGAFDHLGIELTIGIFMLLAGVNFSLYYGALKFRSLRIFFRSTEFRVYTGLVLIGVTLMTLFLFPQPHTNMFDALRKAFFLVATTLTSTGFGTDDYTVYQPVAIGIMLVLMFVGGSAGSTAGGIKVARATLVMKMIWAQSRKSFRPTVIHVIRMSRKAVPAAILSEVGAFFMVYMLTLGIGILAIAMIEGFSIPASFGAVLTCLSNMGPAPFHETTADNFSEYSQSGKYLLSVTMILGRLEFFTLLSLLLPDFWKR